MLIDRTLRSLPMPFANPTIKSIVQEAALPAKSLPNPIRSTRFIRLRHAVAAQPLFRLALLTAAAVAIHGYHYGADDGAVYLPAVLKFLHPNLYPYGAEFFTSHARFSQFAWIVAASAKATRLNAQWAIFLWYLATTFALLLAAWQLAALCFDSARARWSAVLLLAPLLTIPAAGTALVLMDPYLTARSASTPFAIFAVAAFLAERRRASILWLALTALVHPQMALLAAACLGILALPSAWTDSLFKRRLSSPGAVAGAFGFSFGPAASDYRRTLDMRPFLFVTRWTWYEWIGVAAPLGFLLGCGASTPRGVTPAFTRISRTLALFGIAATLAAIPISSSDRLESLVRLQPMRAFHLIYIVFFLLLGGLLGEYLPKSRYWLGAALSCAIAVGMFLVQMKTYPDSRHIEWPGAAPRNPWVAAFVWARDHTPTNAVFALDPNYIDLPGEDRHGFRAIAERSVLSDEIKDSGVVTLFPQLASEWGAEQAAQRGWQRFQLADFQQLARDYPVSWVVLTGAAVSGLTCPYKNQTVTVCHIPNAPGS